MNKICEELSVVSTVDPQSSSTALNGDVIDMLGHERAIFVLSVGALGTSATVDFAVNGDTASNGSFATAITGKSATQLTKAGSDDNKQVVIEVTAEEARAQGYRYLRPTVTPAVAACLVSLVVLADNTYAPAGDYDLASVDEIVK